MGVILLSVLVLHVAGLVSADTVADCYCLHKEVDGIRGPVHVEGVPLEEGNVFLIGEQPGIIYKYNPFDVNGITLKPYVNVSHLVVFDVNEIEENDGLMSFTAHPDFATNKKLYLYTIRDINGIHYVVISEITGTDVATEKILIVIEHRIGAAKGGQLLFDLDGFLYVFVSDSELGSNLTQSQAQNGENLLGKVLRLDVDKVTVADFKMQYYDIPQGNPVRPSWRPEVYAIGLANPWRCTVDKGDSSGRIFCGEINDGTEEEINLIQPNANYGHPYKEGMTCVVNETLCTNIADEVLPIYSFNQSAGPIYIVIGGPVYRGQQYPSISRQLIIGDAATGPKRAITVKCDGRAKREDVDIICDAATGLLYTLEENSATSSWTLHNFTECSPDMCGCNYESPRRRFLFSIGETFEAEPLLLMTDSPKPGDPMAVMLSLHKPQSSITCGSTSTTCSTLLFDLDGFLYVFVSDSELGSNLTQSQAQNGENLLGKVLRLDVDKVTVADFKMQYYDIPQGNPARPSWRPEVYAIGLANPWRCTVDKGDSSGRIFCGEINDGTEEEINLIQPNANYGHPYKEGMTCVVNETLCTNIADEVLPIYSFNQSAGPIYIVIGGPVYRGQQYPSISRQLIIGDAATGLLYTLEENSATSTWTLNNFTECSPEMCGCNYESPRRRFLFSIGETFEAEPLLLMTDSPKPGDPMAVMLSLHKPQSSITCGSTSTTCSTLTFIAALLLLAFKNWAMP